jgi:hypothetical protein
MQYYREMISILKNLMAEKIIFVIICLSNFHQNSLYAQVLSGDSLKIDKISTATIDIFGNLYLSDEKGQLLKIDPSPLAILRYSGKQTLGYNKIDAGSFNKIAVFSRDQQIVRIFDKNLNPLTELSLSPAFASSATCICLSSDNNFWIFDETGQVLKKINPVTGRIVQTIDCSSVLVAGQASIADMKEYSNRLYMLDGDQNVYIFNFMGNLINTIRAPGIRCLQFHDNNLISADGGNVNFINLDNGAVTKKAFNGDTSFGLYFSENYFYEISRNILIKPVGKNFYH